jgi:DNA polymerase-3 subunit alpha
VEVPEFRAVVLAFRPATFIVSVVLCRPGPLGSDMADEVVDRRDGRTPIPALHPFADDVLADTYGVVLFRDQFDAIVTELADHDVEAAGLLFLGLTRGEGDWTELSNEFVDRVACSGHGSEAAEAVFQRLLRDALWTCNERDVIDQDASLVVQTAYLRAHHPAEFAAAVALVPNAGA